MLPTCGPRAAIPGYHILIQTHRHQRLIIMLSPLLSHIRLSLPTLLIAGILNGVFRGAYARGESDVGVFGDAGAGVSF